MSPHEDLCTGRGSRNNRDVCKSVKEGFAGTTKLETKKSHLKTFSTVYENGCFRRVLKTIDPFSPLHPPSDGLHNMDSIMDCSFQGLPGQMVKT